MQTTSRRPSDVARGQRCVSRVGRWKEASSSHKEQKRMTKLGLVTSPLSRLNSELPRLKRICRECGCLSLLYNDSATASHHAQNQIRSLHVGTTKTSRVLFDQRLVVPVLSKYNLADTRSNKGTLWGWRTKVSDVEELFSKTLSAQSVMMTMTYRNWW